MYLIDFYLFSKVIFIECYSAHFYTHTFTSISLFISFLIVSVFWGKITNQYLKRKNR